MNEYKRHIALLLIICFSFPQVATSMHYILNEHQTSGKTLQYLPAAQEIEHHCTCHLASLLYRITNLTYPIQNISLINLGEQAYCSLENYVFELAFNYRLRGPPDFIHSHINKKTIL